MSKPRDSKDLPTYEYVSQRLSYDPETGVLTWKERPREMFATEGAFKTWNIRHVNKQAGSLVHNRGYVKIRLSVFGKPLRLTAHRVAWLLHTGSWPELHLDHINGDKQDNRIENLRQVTPAENARNQRLCSGNTSGHLGVDYRKDCPNRPWCAKIKVDRKSIYLGSYATKEEAIAARKEAERKYGFHENHGRITDDRLLDAQEVRSGDDSTPVEVQGELPLL